MLPLLKFQPVFKERVWGGQKLQALFGKPIPKDQPIGESWEITDRLEDQSVVAYGFYAGKTLRWLMENHGLELLGWQPAPDERFPLLVKILDAREKLSLQVHPPADRAAALGGDPKTEMWFIADAEPGAMLFAGLMQGVTREVFTRKIADGTVADCFHGISVRAGDAMFLSSGRVHAIGEGNVIFEIQQNSDTTYRVFDWNRVGMDGKPRQLHIEQSLECIDFNDSEPGLVEAVPVEEGVFQRTPLVDDALFAVTHIRAEKAGEWQPGGDFCSVIGLVRGGLEARAGENRIRLTAGEFCVLPACLVDRVLSVEPGTEFLLIQPGRSFAAG